MERIGEQGPGVAWRPGGGQPPPQPLEEGRPVGGIPDDRSPLDPPADHVVQDPGCVQTCEARHGRSICHEGKETTAIISNGHPLTPDKIDLGIGPLRWGRYQPGDDALTLRGGFYLDDSERAGSRSSYIRAGTPGDIDWKAPPLPKSIRPKHPAFHGSPQHPARSASPVFPWARPTRSS